MNHHRGVPFANIYKALGVEEIDRMVEEVGRQDTIAAAAKITGYGETTILNFFRYLGLQLDHGGSRRGKSPVCQNAPRLWKSKRDDMIRQWNQSRNGGNQRSGKTNG